VNTTDAPLPREIVIRPGRRTYSPILRQATLPETITVPWWATASSVTNTADQLKADPLSEDRR